MNAPLIFDPSQANRQYKLPWPEADDLWRWREIAFDGDMWARFVINLIEKATNMSHEFNSIVNGRPVSMAVPSIIMAALWQHDHACGFRWVSQNIWGDQVVPNGGQRINTAICRGLAACAADLISSWAAEEGLAISDVHTRLRDDPRFSPECIVACTVENPIWQTVDLVQQLATEQLCVGPGMEIRAAAARHEPGDDAQLPRLRITLTEADRSRLVVRPGRADFRLVDVARLGQYLATIPFAEVS